MNRSMIPQKRAEDEADLLRAEVVALRAARDRAIASARAMGSFLASMSHEIRTPMTGILGMSELLLDTPLDLTQRDYAATIQHSAEALLTVINDILDLSRIEAGKLTVRAVELNLRTLMNEVAGLLAASAYLKGLELWCRVPPGFPDRLVGDPDRIRQVVMNLAGNAIKFTETGEVVLEVRLLAQTETDVSLRIEVHDTGIGIPPDQHAAIFDSFNRAGSEAESSRRVEGTGLGLTICRQLARLMGGEVGLESEPGAGSTFWVELTLTRLPSHEVKEPIPARASRPGSLGLRVLLADDHAINRHVALRMLDQLGCQVVAVTNGREALEALERATYDVVLMDLQMPDLDGLEATTEIRHREAGQGEGRRTPILALTAHAMDGDQQRCLAAGMDGSITKPMKRIDLYESLARWAAPGPCTLPTGEPSSDPLLKPLPFDRLDDLCGDDRALRAELIHLFRSTVPRLLSGVSAALGREDAPGASTEAHSLKGIAATIGADRLADPSDALERAARRGDLAAARTAFDRIRDAWAELQPILDAPA